MQPNIVFIIDDQHRWDFLGTETSNGVTHTPNLDQLAANGAQFRRAYCPAPLCSPAREAIVSGRHSSNTGCFTNLHELPPGTPTYVSQLRAAGYRTCAIGKTHMEIHAYDSDYTNEPHRRFMDSLGYDEVCEISGNGMLKTGIKCAYTEFLKEQGAFQDVLDFYYQWRYFMDSRPGDPDFASHPWTLAPDLQETEFVGARAVQWLQSHANDGPFYLHVGFAGPHSPTEPAPDFLDLYEADVETAPVGNDAPTPWTEAGRRGYRAMITQIDHHVGAIRRTLERMGVLDNTIIVFVSDHGEMAGDHGRFGKTCFYEASAHVPLILTGPGVKAGVDSQALVETIDLGATLCEMSGVQTHDLDQGRSLAPLLAGRADAHRETVYSEMGCDKMLFDGRYKLMWGDPGLGRKDLGRLHLDKPVTIPASPGHLYDLENDPHELNDLIADPAQADLLHAMLGKLLARINENTQTQPNKSRGEYKPLR